MGGTLSNPRELSASKAKRAAFVSPSFFVILPQFLSEESNLFTPKLFLIAALGGISNGLVVAVVLTAIRTREGSGTDLRLLLLFVLCIAVYLTCKLYAVDQTVIATEAVLRKVRLRVVDKIRRAELADFERIGASRYYTTLTGELQSIVETSKLMIAAASSVFMVAGGLAYIAYLSISTAIATVLTVVLGYLYFSAAGKKIEVLLKQALITENSFFDRMRDMRDGFKELKINATKSDDLFDNYVVRSALLAEHLKTTSGKLFNRNTTLAQSFLYLLIGVVVFVLPAVLDLDTTTITKVVAALIFIMGPLAELIVALNSSMRAAAAIINLRQLEMDLERIKPVPREPREPTEVFGPFQKLTLSGVTFVHEESGISQPFRLKPTDLTVHRGDVIFLVGGNGSGKSTLISVLCGLHQPAEGEIRVNGKLVRDENLTAYRSHFSIILQDYHLFERLYGHVSPDLEAANTLFEELGLVGKTSLREDGSFETINLSGGQRKRLAMVVARLDNPLIFVFDEWAADQDPGYKKRFYEETLPMLTSMGKTVIAVSHDDRYFPADHRNVYRMEDGALYPYTGAAPSSGPERALPPSEIAP